MQLMVSGRKRILQGLQKKLVLMDFNFRRIKPNKCPLFVFGIHKQDLNY